MSDYRIKVGDLYVCMISTNRKNEITGFTTTPHRGLAYTTDRVMAWSIRDVIVAKGGDARVMRSK